jgi:ribonuclease PH
MRSDGRKPDQLRPLKIRRRFTQAAPGSVLIQAGRTVVLCTADISPKVPPWMAGQGRGWITAEYGMVPGSTRPRKERRADGRIAEIQRMIGRSLRAIADLDALGERTVTLDCDVLEADGGTRTLAITGAFIALVEALQEKPLAGAAWPLKDSVAAVSAGLVEGQPILDLDYAEDLQAAADLNVVMTGSGRFVEIQGAGEEATFDESDLKKLLALARRGIRRLTALQKKALGKQWPGE